MKTEFWVYKPPSIGYGIDRFHRGWHLITKNYNIYYMDSILLKADKRDREESDNRFTMGFEKIKIG